MADEIKPETKATLVTHLPQEEKNQDASGFGSGAKVQLKAIGASGTEIFSGYFNEEYLRQLRGRAGAKIYDEMRRSETQVVMLLNAVMNPIKAGVWEFEAPAEVADGEKHKELVEFISKKMIDWETHLHEALTMMIFGYSLFEIVHSVVYNHPKFGTFNGLKGLAFRNQKTIERWIVSRDTGNLECVEQWIQGDITPENSSLIKMPAEFLLVFTLQKEGDNYEGISALRPMYGPWFRKNLYLKIAAIGLEKNAVGTPMGTIPAGKLKDGEVEEFESILSNFTAHELAYIVKPAGWEVEILKHEFDAAAVKEMLVFENTEMINSLVANFLALGTSGGGGSYALGSDLSDFFLTGIQNYANIICGVWNRKLIPDLIKLNYGEQSSYPTLKATGINDKAGKELAEIVGGLITNKGITPDMKLEEFLRKSYSLPKIDAETAKPIEPEPQPELNPEPALLSERHMQLAETWKQKFKINKDSVKEEMEAGLFALLESYKKQISSKYKSSTPAQRVNIGLKLEPKGAAAYIDSLTEILAEIANESLIDARKETPKARDVKLSESIQLAAPKGGYFNALPPKVKRLVRAQARLIGETQAADINKIVSFQYGSSAASTEDLDTILLDIDDAVLPVINGSTAKGISIEAAASNAVATIANQARLEWFFEPEVLDTIESFTFYNESPISDVCAELNGTTWAVNDPDLDRYSPPLHHNCKSRILANEKRAKGNPERQPARSTDLSDKARKNITLCEHDYHLTFELKEPKTT